MQLPHCPVTEFPTTPTVHEERVIAGCCNHTLKRCCMEEQSPQFHAHLFTVRLWQETLDEGTLEWRGKVKYVASEEERTFRGFEEIGKMMVSLLPRLREETTVVRRKQ